MKYLTVRLWGEELGRLVWDSQKRITYFIFNPSVSDRPDVAPLMQPADKWDPTLPVYGDTKRIYQGLPPFIADSLPDSWGNKLFDKWVKKAKIPRNKISPLSKLMFIGKRGMGALEFEPALKELEHIRPVDINQLYNLSLEILEERESVTLSLSDELTLEALLAVGTSAGGRQMKAIIAINENTGEIRSGQTDPNPEFGYYIIKFEDKIVPTTEIEMAYYEMAIACGIAMEECRTLQIDGISHFMTHRFDRKNGEKIHMQTLAAINPEADSYEDLFSTCRNLGLTETEIIEVFRRMVFNVLANNTDDHNKNFSFLLNKGGKWELSPAYDLTFIFNRNGTGPEIDRCMSLYGNTQEISKDEILEFAKENNIRNANAIIAEVANAISKFPELAEKYKIPSRWRHIIQTNLHSNLVRFGYAEPIQHPDMVTDSNGKVYSHITLSTNTKGIYQLSVQIDEQLHKKHIKPDTEHYHLLQRYESGELPKSELIELLEQLFR